MSDNKVLPFERQSNEQACAWVARIDAGPLDGPEREELLAWLAQDELHRRLLDEYALLWAHGAKARFPSPAKTAQPRPRLRLPLVALGTASALVLALVVLLPLHRPPEVEALHVTAIAERRPLKLPDGSSGELNAASTLRVLYTPDHRRVQLERGEGLFEVAKDARRPFEVVAGDTVVRAIGTRFLVQRHADARVEVTVYEGVVEVFNASALGVPASGKLHPTATAGPQALRVGMGQTATSLPDHVQLAAATTPLLERKLAWQHGRLAFDHTPLAEALESVNRYSPVPIRLGPSAAEREMLISGSFDTQDVGVFLRSLEQGLGLRVQREESAWLLEVPVAEPAPSGFVR